jgi:LuxR family maltose regulon positive regulatory protein
VSGEQAVLAQAKFRVPWVPNAVVRRDGLVAQLDAARGCPLSLVVAAPGSGKTALLADWVNGLEDRVAWMSCDPADADPSTFWRNLIVGASLTWEELGVATAELQEEPSTERIAIGLANELATRSEPSVLVIDDFHLADGDPAVMSAFVAALPRSARLVLGTRADPPFPVGRMRLQGRLLELRQADLQFTADEARELLGAIGVELADQELGALMSLTEGWVAGVYLAGLRLQTDRDPGRLLRSMAETDHSLVDFLMSEVMDLLAPDLVEFLMLTAELESFDAELCDAVRGTHNSGEMLERVRSSNLFLVELDREGAWYRYHHLFAQFLRGRLRAVARDRLPMIHRAAAGAYRQRGDLMRAVQQSMTAGDEDLALEMLGAYVTSAWSFGEDTARAATARRWLRERGALGQDWLPQGVLLAAIVLNTLQVGDEVELWLRRLTAREPDLDASSRFLLHGAWGFYFLHRGDPVAALSHASRSRALMSEHEVTTVWVQALPFILVQTQLWLDDLDGAEATLAAARASGTHPPIVTQVRLPGLASQVEVARGELRDAATSAASALAAADQLDLDDLNFGRAEPELTLGIVALERDALDEASAHLERVMRISEGGRRPQVEMLVHLQLARLASARGEGSEVAEALERARQVLPQATAPVTARIDRVELDCALALGDLPRAETLARWLPASPRTDLLTARLRLAVEDPSGARAVLDAMSDRLATKWLRVAHGLLAAQALATEDRARALEILGEVLALAEPAGFHRSIVSGGPTVRSLLEALPATGSTGRYVDGLLAAAHRFIPPRRVAPQAGLAEPLSDRELTVLRYLASRLTTTEIARELYLSVNTVRSHVKAIYRKLGVSSRAEAVQRGREVRLS